MAAPSTQGPRAEKIGLSVDTTAVSHQQQPHRPSQDTLASQEQHHQAFPPLVDEKSLHLPPPRASDVSTPATARANPFDTDVEAMITHNTTHSSRRSNDELDAVECTKGGTDCHVWPGQEHWRRKAKAAKKSRHNCACLAGMSKRNRILVRILIIVVIVGVAVGVGFGVSKPLGTGIWRSEGQNGS